jgi:hypothetical protein
MGFLLVLSDQTFEVGFGKGGLRILAESGYNYLTGRIMYKLCNISALLGSSLLRAP